MLQIELYKIFKRKLVWISLLIVFFLVIFSGMGMVYLFSGDTDRDRYEVETYEKHKGILTDERLGDFLDDYSIGEYDYAQDFIEDGKPIPVRELYPGIDFEIHFGYFAFWGYFFSDFIGNVKYVIIFIVVAFASIFTYEKECGMQEILLSTQKGRRACTRAKVLAAFLISNTIYVLVLVLSLIPLLVITDGGKGWDTSIQMLPWLSGSLMEMNFIELSGHSVFLSVVSVNLILLVTLCASFLAEKPMAAMCVTLGILFAVRTDVFNTFLGNAAVNRIVAMMPLNVADAGNLARQAPVMVGGAEVSWLTAAEATYSILLVGTAVFFFRCLARHPKYYAV